MRNGTCVTKQSEDTDVRVAGQCGPDLPPLLAGGPWFNSASDAPPLAAPAAGIGAGGPLLLGEQFGVPQREVEDHGVRGARVETAGVSAVLRRITQQVLCPIMSRRRRWGWLVTAVQRPPRSDGGRWCRCPVPFDLTVATEVDPVGAVLPPWLASVDELEMILLRLAATIRLVDDLETSAPC